ncbi:MAG: ABC transporter permease [Azospirillaceae bacterium]|nr:ABC transporter permease [Azospirillaceae bacterium]
MADTAAGLTVSPVVARPALPARGPWATAMAILLQNRAAMSALFVLLCIIAACLAAPLYAHQIAHVDAFQSNVDGEIDIDGTTVAVLEPNTEGLGLGVTPIGPTGRFATYWLGADSQGRDVFARLLYGGRNSLMIAGIATVICLSMGVLVGITAGFFGGLIDTGLSRLLDILWAFPVFLLAISLSVVLIHGVQLGPLSFDSGSLVLPILIISCVYIPYVARPVRAQVLTLKHSDFVLAAIGIGVPSARILWRDILPNVMTTAVVFIPLMMVMNIGLESALSYLSVGVQAPDASWGTIIEDGQGLLYSRPWVALAPGIAIALTVLCLNILGDGVRDAFDPRSQVRPG